MANNTGREHVIHSILESRRSDDSLTADILARINKRTMVIWGSDDRITKTGFAHLFAERIKNSRLEIITGAGHYPHYTNPEEVCKLIVNFVV